MMNKTNCTVKNPFSLLSKPSNLDSTLINVIKPTAVIKNYAN